MKATTWCLLLMIVAGVVFRIWNIAEPRFFTFDEGEFIKNSHAYLIGVQDANDHPPLGKLLTSVGLLAFGYNSLGWRFAALCFGLQNILVAACLARALFQSSRAAWFAAAFVAADGFFLAYSRVALLDGILACLVLWSVLAAVTARGVVGVALSALLVGLAASVKWSGAFAGIPAVMAVLWFGRAPKASVLLFLLAPVVHLAVWTLGLAICHEPYDPVSLFQLMKRLFSHHLALGKNDNALASPWYTWPVLYHPIVVKFSAHGLGNRYASSAGNPLFWYPASLLVLGLPLALALGRVWRRVKLALGSLDRAEVRAGLILVVGWFALFSPWIVARGKFTFMYHYLPSYGFALILLAGALAYVERQHARAAHAFSAAALVVAAFYMPVWAELPVSTQAANARLVFASWRP